MITDNVQNLSEEHKAQAKSDKIQEDQAKMTANPPYQIQTDEQEFTQVQRSTNRGKKIQNTTHDQIQNNMRDVTISISNGFGVIQDDDNVNERQLPTDIGGDLHL